MSTPETFEPYVFQTRNVSAGENQAHTKEGAQAMGFRGSIVGGAIVYGQMLRPLVERCGEEWLGRNWLSVRFKAPAYDDDRLTSQVVFKRPDEGAATWRVTVTNEAGQELVEMSTHIPDALPAVDPLATLEPVEWEGERVQGTWERMELNIPFRRFVWCIMPAQQLTYCDRSGETLNLYRVGETPPVHPGLLMSQGSFAVQNQFVMPFWVHASSTILTRGLMRVGDAVELRCIPIEKWKRGDNEWVTFYQVYAVNDQPLVEAWQTAIIKVAPRHSSLQ